MTVLYRRNGGVPAPLPVIAYDAANNAYTPPFAAEDLVRLGFAVAPSQPAFDAATQIVVWDAADEAWRIKQRPIVPDVPIPPDLFAGFIPVYLLRQRAEKLGIWDELASYIGQSPALLLKIATLEAGMVDPAYPDLVKGLDDLGVPADVRAYLLADSSLGVPDVAAA